MPEATNDSVEVALLRAVQAFVGRRVLDATLAEDISQETVSNVLRRAPDLDDDALVAYAVASARNAIRSEYRKTRNKDQFLARQIDPEQRAGDVSGEAILLEEEHEAVRRAVTTLHESDRELLLAHHVGGADLRALSSAEQSHGALAVKLARARAKLRLEYLLTFRKITLPTDRCRPVLLALSMGDIRRQEALRAGDHLNACLTCASLAPPLLERQRGLAALVPFAGLGAPNPLHLLKTHPYASGATAAAGTAAVVAAVALTNPSPAVPPAAPDPCAQVITVNGTSLSAVSPSALAAGSTVVVHHASVQAVPADEGFRLACGDKTLWVQLTGGGESAETITPGSFVTFEGKLSPHGKGFAAAAGVDAAEGGPALDDAGVHAEVNRAAVTLG